MLATIKRKHAEKLGRLQITFYRWFNNIHYEKHNGQGIFVLSLSFCVYTFCLLCVIFVSCLLFMISFFSVFTIFSSYYIILPFFVSFLSIFFFVFVFVFLFVWFVLHKHFVFTNICTVDLYHFYLISVNLYWKEKSKNMV